MKDLDYCLNNYKSIIVYGAGNYGKTLVNYLIAIGEKEKIKGMIVTDHTNVPGAYRNIVISEAREFWSNRVYENACVIVAVSLRYQKSITTLLEKYNIDNYYCLTKEVYREIAGGGINEKTIVPYHGLTFLVAGFMKCGTTALHRVLMNVESIYVPIEKETAYFSWFNKVSNPEEELIKRYFSCIKEGQKIVGTVDPTFYLHAKEIYKYFGKNIKIILMMRNPVDATFSIFKMMNRDGYAGEIFEEIYNKYGCYHQEMFTKYCERVINDEKYIFNYDYWYQDFLKYFSKEQIQVILFEELIKSQHSELNRILNFIGVNRIAIDLELPKVNEGNFVMKKIEGFKIARRKTELQWMLNHFGLIKNEYNSREEIKNEFLDICEKYEQADKINNLEVDKKVQDKLKLHFDKSVRSLETMLNRNLHEIWF